MLIKVKPMSVNEAFKGKKYKTDTYKTYEKVVMLLLKDMEVPKTNIRLNIVAGLSSKLADIDNIAKPFIDILQRKYNFNDREIKILYLEKVNVDKGDEFIDFTFSEL